MTFPSYQLTKIRQLSALDFSIKKRVLRPDSLTPTDLPRAPAPWHGSSSETPVFDETTPSPSEQDVRGRSFFS